MRKCMSLGLFLVAITVSFAESEKDPRVEARTLVRSQLQWLLTCRGDTGIQETIDDIDAKIAALGEKHGNALLISVLKDIARSHAFYREEACNVLEQEISREQYISFLKKLRADLEQDLNRISLRLRRLVLEESQSKKRK